VISIIQVLLLNQKDILIQRPILAPYTWFTGIRPCLLSADRWAVLSKSRASFTHGGVTSSRGERDQALLPASPDGGVEHVLHRVPESEPVVEELLGREVHQREVVIDPGEPLRDVVLGVPVPEHCSEAVDGGVLRGADVAAGGVRVLKEVDLGIAEVVEVDVLHLLEDRVVRLVPRDQRQPCDEAWRHCRAEERADHQRGDDANEVQAVLRRVCHGLLLRQGLGHEVHLRSKRHQCRCCACDSKGS
jgi:hypothetical protein